MQRLKVVCSPPQPKTYRCSADMWRALTKTGSNFDLIVLVNILLKKLQVNPSLTGNYIMPLAVSSK